MRALEEHLSPQELANLPESPEQLALGGAEHQQLLRHLRQCEPCAALAQTHWSLRHMDKGDGAADEDACPHEMVWLELASSLRPVESEDLLAHAAKCRHCAAMLQEAMELMQPLQSESIEVMTHLSSATPAWQQRMAERLTSETAKGTKQQALRQNVFFARRSYTWMAIAATLLLVTSVGILSWRLAQPSETRLLAMAYNKHRTLALRIPDGDPEPMASGKRAANSGLEDPSELTELRLRAQKNLEQAPDNPYWRQILGRIDLMHQDGLSARRNFEFAQTVAPNLPGIQADLASAWFVLGEKSGNMIDYARASNLYLAALASLKIGSPEQLAILHYNLALCWERQNLTEDALKEFRIALSLDHSKRWRDAIQSEIDHLASGQKVGDTSEILNRDEYEAALAEVSANLLPLWSSSPEAKEKIARTAELGVRHHDRWLSDWIATAHTTLSDKADRHLTLAARAANEGASQTLLSEASLAHALYAASHNLPGQIRSEYAITYAYQRLGRTQDCITSADNLEKYPQLKDYSLLRARALLDHSMCQIRDGRYQLAEQETAKVLSIARQSHLPQVQMYALFVHSSTLTTTGRPSAAWQIDADGLRLCAVYRCSAVRQYAFLYDMVSIAQNLELAYTAAAIMESAVSVASLATDKVTYAYALETQGTLAGCIGDFSTSTHAFAEAAKVAGAGHHAAMLPLYQAEWKIDQAEILSREGKVEEAWKLLQQSAPDMLASDYIPGRVKLYRETSAVELRQRRDQEALASALAAVAEDEKALAGLTSIASRERWVRESAPDYAQLVEVYLSRSENTAALRSWERFRAAPYRQPGSSSTRIVENSQSGDRNVIVLARLNHTYVGWVARAPSMQALHTVVLGDRTHLQQAVTAFYRLCSDSGSTLDDIHLLGSRLYKELFSALDIRESKSLEVDLDPSIAILPVSALTPPSGGWVADTAAITVLPDWWSLARGDQSSEPPRRAQYPLLVNGFDRDHLSDAETSELLELLPHATLLSRGQANRDAILQHLRSADLFHFSGHASEDQGVLLPAVTERPAALTTESFEGLPLPHCRLAVLAACNTTAADPDRIEQLPDLRSAFLLAGAQAVVASNWDVDDRGTHALMVYFYRHLTAGMSPTRALQYAQQSVRASQQWQHPYYWAAFEVFTN